METTSRIVARYSETDQMGVIHHGVYINWFEIGRTDCIREQMGKPYSEMEKDGLMLPAIRSEVNYRSPAKYEDALIVKTTIAKYNGIRITFRYELVKEDDQKLVADGITEHCFTNLDLKPVALKKVAADLHQKIETACKEQ
ncbi:acyl-CoA thioester hydrolase [Scopulibacillus daqui]|uniref:Acyl-CoA thioester hydrolase n=1 Tax=Scopulibacillus daqui TaxID=1469162 RepID=A0ABS2PXQ5_9BACL|nr:thioesterase family protein [Scopulibacillus daqui]MBM7644795.1 acyl-CoA thioester hydrolase [Scopulibacillus daqui]